MAVSGVVGTAISLTKPFTPSSKLLLSEFYKNKFVKYKQKYFCIYMS